MLFDPKYEPHDALEEQLRHAHALTPDLISLAILSAFVEARRRASAMDGTSLQTVPPVRRTSGYAQFVAIISAEPLLLRRW